MCGKRHIAKSKKKSPYSNLYVNILGTKLNVFYRNSFNAVSNVQMNCYKLLKSEVHVTDKD